MTVQIQRPSGINVGINNPGNAIFISGRGLAKGDLRCVKQITGSRVDVAFEEATLNVASVNLQVWKDLGLLDSNKVLTTGKAGIVISNNGNQVRGS